MTTKQEPKESPAASELPRAGRRIIVGRPPSFLRRFQGNTSRVPEVSGRASKLSYAICTNPRSGSWLLCEGLTSTLRAGHPLEYLNLGEEQKSSARWRIKFSDDSDLPDYLSHLIKKERTSNGIFGLKLHYYQFIELPTRLAAIEELKGLPISQFMSTAFPNIQYLWLTRIDKARQAISFYRAYKTGIWWHIRGLARPEPSRVVKEADFDPQTIFRLEQVLTQNDAGWQSYFKDNSIAPFILRYEDFVGNYAESLREVLKWLKVPNANAVPIRPPRLMRQSDSQTEEWLVEYLKYKEDSKRHVDADASPAGLPIEIVSPLLELSKKFRERARIPQRPYKVLSLLKVFRALESLRTGGNGIPRRTNLSRREFMEQYYACNRPVIIQGIIKDWPALLRWTPQYLKDKAGNDQVEIEAVCGGEAGTASTSRKRRRTISFSEFVDLVYTGVAANHYCLKADNRFFKLPGASQLLHDFSFLGEYLDPADNRSGSPFFEFGPLGTIMPLHHDLSNSLMAQVIGQRHFKLIPASQWEYVYNEIGNLSQVDCEQPNFSRWPQFRNATVVDFDLQPGEVLFMPVGWWYHCRALEANIGLSFTNFVFPNQYEWPQPVLNLHCGTDELSSPQGAGARWEL